jgi:acyl-CoA synthetase (AMP-forming)/AMP-acid ligase II
MNSAEFMEAYFALAKVGAVVVPLNWRLVPDELEFILKDSGTRRLIYGEEFVDTVAELHARGDKTDIGQWLQVAGGGAGPLRRQLRGVSRPAAHRASRKSPPVTTTCCTSCTPPAPPGLPKGVVHTHHTALWAVLTIAATAEYVEADRYLAALPMFHVGALTPLAVNVYKGATSVVMRSFEPNLAWQLIERERITTGLMVPAMLNFMLQADAFRRCDYSSLRWIMTGAAPVPVALTEKYSDLGIGVLQVYGLTESCGPACVMDSENALRKPGSTGKAFFHTEVRIVDEQGNACPPGEAGEVVVRGAHNMREYWNRPEATAETLKNGWLHTGDVAIMDEEGFVFIQDRIKDMIISGGENVYPAEVEGVLASHPKIVEAAVIGQAQREVGRVAAGHRGAQGRSPDRGRGHGALPRQAGRLQAPPGGGVRRPDPAQPQRQDPEAGAAGAVPRPGGGLTRHVNMKIEELAERLGPFCQAEYDDPAARVFDVVAMPGHAGFAYGFRVESGGRVESWFIRLPPPNVNWRGTADVLRQVAVLNALDGTAVPHCSVKWSGDDLSGSAAPTSWCPGSKATCCASAKGEWGSTLSDAQLHDLGREVMTALANVHKVDPAKASYLGEAVPFEEDVTRWDRFYERAADPERLRDARRCARSCWTRCPRTRRWASFTATSRPRICSAARTAISRP